MRIKPLHGGSLVLILYILIFKRSVIAETPSALSAVFLFGWASHGLFCARWAVHYFAVLLMGT